MRKLIMTMAAAAALTTSAAAQTTPSANPAVSTTIVSEDFVVATPTDILSYNLVGLNIKNSADETIGEIRDLILSNGQLAGFIVSVGGFLGIGERYVIVNPSAVDVTYNESDKKWSARMDTTKEVLKAAPEFKYEGRWAR